MSGSDHFEIVFAVTAFLTQIVLIFYFALRKWRFGVAMQIGPVVYALSVPAALTSWYLLLGDMKWSFWIGGFLYLAWAIFGYTVEYLVKIQWRSPIYWPVFVPHIGLYLAMMMFYWWPLANIHKQLWLIYTALFIASTFLNLSSHKKPFVRANQGVLPKATRLLKR